MNPMATGCLTSLDGVEHYRIDGVEQMEPFLTTVVSDADLWMFVSSSGALTAGRVDADHALFPYVTDDQLHRAAGLSGPVTVIARTERRRRELWRPFAPERTLGCVRSIAKSVLGDRLVFEEHHHGWQLAFRATWAPSGEFGWMRTVELVDQGGGGAKLEVLDGLVDVMPAGVDAHTEQIRSNLADAYKRSETGPWGSLAVFSLESLISDRAEPAEALTATTVWSAGFADATVHLDGRAVATMVDDQPADPCRLVTGRPGAYLLRGPVDVPATGSVSWLMVVDTGLAHADVVATARIATDPAGAKHVLDDIAAGSARLRELLRGADGLQSTGESIADAHHLSNVLFNSMRGGVFPYGHQVPVADLAGFVHDRNRAVAQRCRAWFVSLQPWVHAADLRVAALGADDPDLTRLVLEYLPLTFSRRHGDPSRPWNRFSINVRNEDGGELLSYEGNWRDIFQNWEALLRSYPAYFANVVAKFVNASTIDGFNPYRISRDGIDWEVPDPDDPWSHIGYWGDHQIVYLLRLLEAWEDHEPGAISEWLDRPVFVYADVPYLLADHESMVRDPRDTITYDEQAAAMIARREQLLGSDGRLVVDTDGSLLRVGLAEKLLVPALAKLSSFVPGGGIWLNTQRPEWNDANNALAGPGLSMVTLYHLDRYLGFVDTRLGELGDDARVSLSSSVAEWCTDLLDVLASFSPPDDSIDDRARRSILDALGGAAADHRRRVVDGASSRTVDVPVADLRRLCSLAVEHIETTVRTAQRPDGLYHSYNLVSFPTADTAAVVHLGPMLEGQVAVLSAGVLDAAGVLDLVDALFASAMYRPDQDTFMLYPAVELPSFLDRNVVPRDVGEVALGPGESLREIFATDAEGVRRFRPEFVNQAALDAALDATALSAAQRESISQLYDDVFDHHSFTGRSGRMYGYEGIGSVYWHMVAKLLLAVQESYWAAIDAGESDELVGRLAGAYSRIRSGLGFRKGPAEYGAFPTDCYSHTPAHAGAQQPGMTGQVKEEVLTRFGELGVRVVQGCVSLAPGLLPAAAVLPSTAATGGPAELALCGVPMTIAAGDADRVDVVCSDGTAWSNDGLSLSAEESRELFSRRGTIDRIDWTIGPTVMERWRGS
jgi:hypothetical protein